MDGDSLRTIRLYHLGPMDEIWIVPSPSISDCGELIDIDTKVTHDLLLLGLKTERAKVRPLNYNKVLRPA
jgi:hypothetical protein